MDRLDKLLSSRGIGSRKDVQRLIRSGEVTVDGEIVKRPEFKADPKTNEIRVSGNTISSDKHIYLMMNKPAGVVSATEDNVSKTVLDLVPSGYLRRGLAPAGRLDKDTTGLLILTDDGEFAHKIISPRKSVYKRYEAQLSGDVTDADVEAFEKGIELSDGYICLPAQLKRTGVNKAEVSIREGKFHQVKRMFSARALTVTALKRLSIGGLELDPDLQPGETRLLSKNEKSVIFLGK